MLTGTPVYEPDSRQRHVGEVILSNGDRQGKANSRFAATKRDAVLTCSVLRECHIDCLACRDVDEVVRESQDGVGAIILAEEILAAGQQEPIAGTAIALSPLGWTCPSC